jgi:ribosome-binding protein aMBF1 (putative translation factor)
MKPGGDKPKSWADTIRWAIAARARSGYELAQRTGVSESVINRFRAKKRSLTLETAERLGKAVGVILRTEKE